MAKKKAVMVLVFSDPEVAGKEKTIHAFLSKFLSGDEHVISPLDYKSDAIISYCKKNNVLYAEGDIEYVGEFSKMFDYAIMFSYSGKRKESYANEYRLGMASMKKMCIVLEVNSEG